MTEDVFETGDFDKMEQRLRELRAQHRDLDARIDQLIVSGDQAFQVMALKREKLRLKDRISWLAARLTPDIIA